MQKYNKGSILILSSTNYYRQKKPVVFLFFILVWYAKKINGSVLCLWIVSISRIICKCWKEIEGNYNMNRLYDDDGHRDEKTGMDQHFLYLHWWWDDQTRQRLDKL